MPEGSGLWVLDDQVSAQSLYGQDFAVMIKSISEGALAEKPRAQYPPLKKVFFMESKYNPAISNTHICYEYDAQFKEMEKHWKRSGKKFSEEPKFDTTVIQGPLKPDNFPQFSEKPVKMFGRTREIRPFSRANHGFSFKFTKPYKPTKDEECAHLGPGTYDPYPNPWVIDEHEVCGAVPNSPTFLSPSRFTKESNRYDINPPLQVVRPNSVRPLTSSGPTVPTFFKVPPCKIKNIDVIKRDLKVAISREKAPEITEQKLILQEKMKAFEAAKIPGFAFLKGKKPPSSLEIVTGTTNADVRYRRVILRDRKETIIPIGAGAELPEGAKYKSTWGNTHLVAANDSKLAVVTQPLLRPTTTESLSPLPSSTEYTPQYRIPPVHKPPRPVTRQKVSTDASNSFIESLGHNSFNDLPPDTAGIPLRLSETVPVSPSSSTVNSRYLQVKSRKRGGGDLLGLKRVTAPYDEASLLKRSTSFLSNSYFDYDDVDA